MREFNPPDPVQDQNPFDIDTRDHRKLLIVDGRVAFTGGINIDRNYARPSDVVGGTSASSGWRDTHIRIDGPAVAAFQQLFVEPLGDSSTSRSQSRHMRRRRAGSTKATRWCACYRPSAATTEVSQIWVAYQAAAKVAADRIWITQSYFAPDDELMAAIHEAAARGVDVRILVAGFSDSELLAERIARVLQATCWRRASRSSKAKSTSCTPRRWSWTATGRPSAAATWTT